MRAIALILVCIFMLAAMQASYLVVEAKKHDSAASAPRVTDDADRSADDWTPAKGHGKKEGKKQDVPEVPPAVANVVAQKNAAFDNEKMLGDQPSRDERRRLRDERKEERRQRKEQKDRMTPEEREAKKQQKAAAKAARQERKQARQEKKANKKQKVTCESEEQCQTGECCMPHRSGQKYCKPNSRPRQDGDRCVTSCSCDGSLNCYVNASAPSTNKRGKPKKNLGVCQAAPDTGDSMVEN
jgi:flagellar biosynthesis GTPase FlhF